MPEVAKRDRVMLKPYVSVDELAALTPWTGQAIRTMVKRRQLSEGVHYFHVGRRLIFKWEKIVEFIEQERQVLDIPMYRQGFAGESEEA
ncbi:MAG: hypothetical protein ACREQ9_10525 [Candidatus Binatia bacterium]